MHKKSTVYVIRVEIKMSKYIACFDGRETRAALYNVLFWLPSNSRFTFDYLFVFVLYGNVKIDEKYTQISHTLTAAYTE